MKYRININWTPENEYVEEWHEMTKDEFLGGLQLLKEDWDEMVEGGAIIPLQNDVVGVASHTLFGRLLFVYALDGVVKCFSADEIRPLKSTMLDIGWSHTATIDPARWIEALVNGNVEPSDMLDELQFCPPREN